MNFNSISDGFGDRFKQVLKRHNVKQSQFGDDTNTHKGLVSRYINGESPSGDFIMKAVAYFPQDIKFLFFGDKVDGVAEEGETYQRSSEEIIADIEQKLNDLKRSLAQK